MDGNGINEHKTMDFTNTNDQNHTKNNVKRNGTTMESRFGGRTFLETTVCPRKDNSDSLFEVSPKHLIVLEEKDDRSISKGAKYIKSTASEVGLAVINENKLLIYDKNLKSPIQTVPFNSSIDFVVWRRSLLLVGTSTSEIILLCPTNFTVKESVRVNPNVGDSPTRAFFVNAFIHLSEDPKCIDMVAVGVNGRLYSFDNVPLSVGSLDSTVNPNMSLDIDFGRLQGIVSKRFLEDEYKSPINYAESPNREMMFTSDEAGKICLFQMEKSYNEDNPYFVNCVTDILEKHGDGDTNVKVTRMKDSEGYLFVLLSNGKLIFLFDEQLCYAMSLKLPSPSYIVHDFAVVSSRMGFKLWTIYGLPGGSSDETFVGIFAGPSFNLEFSLKIVTFHEEGVVETNCPRSYLFPSSGSTLEEPFAFFEIYANHCRVYKMAETSTDATLQKLLSKGRFQEAEELARQFGKDMDIVYKAKVRARVSEIFAYQGTGSNQKLDAMFKEVLSTLMEIRDAEFVCSFCLEHHLPRVNWFKDILNTGMQRVSDCNETEAARKLLLTRKKFYTFEQVMSTETIEEWEDFNKDENTMYQRCLWFLENFEFQKCELVWRRHYDEFTGSISLIEFVPFFSSLFTKKLSSKESVSLFRVIFIDAIEKCISEEGEVTGIGAEEELRNTNENGEQNGGDTNMGLNGMIKLVVKQILSLEREKDWPQGALFFINNLITTVTETSKNYETASVNADAKLPRKRSICGAILTELKRLLQVLNELTELKASHSIIIPFTKYTHESLHAVVNSMLDELFIQEEIDRFISKFLIPFANRYDLSLDDLFQCHVNAVMLELPFFVNTMDIPYQERIVTLISYISCVSIQLDCILLIANEWPVPWSSIIDNMVTKTLQMKTEDAMLKEKIKRIDLLKDQVPFRCLVIKHRLTASKVRKSDGLHMALRRILKHKKANYMEDCLELIRHSDIFTAEDVLVMQFMLTLENNEGRVEDNIPSGSDSMLKQILYRLQQQFRCIDPKGVTGFPPHLYLTPEEWESFSLATKIVANKLNHTPTLEFLQLRKFVKDLWDVDQACDRDYPFSVLTHHLPEAASKSSQEIISDCAVIGDITFHHTTDILAAAAMYFQSGKNCSKEKWWDIIDTIVKTPDLFTKSSVAENAAMNIAHLLIQQCPFATDQQMETVHSFLVLICESSDKLLLPAAKLFNIHRIFSTLREQEIPQEKEFLYIYNCYSVEGVDDYDDYMAKLREFCTVLLKFGEIDLFHSIFSNIEKEYLEQEMILDSTQEDMKEAFLNAVEATKQLQDELFRSLEQLEEKETNPVISGLLKDLESVGINLNGYALRQRSKKKLLDKLIELKEHDLASRVALVFNFKNSDSWSRILKGFINANDMSQLKKVLESLKNIHELWILPEFTTAWLTVSKDDPGFKAMCPIPLM